MRAAGVEAPRVDRGSAGGARGVAMGGAEERRAVPVGCAVGISRGIEKEILLSTYQPTFGCAIPFAEEVRLKRVLFLICSSTVFGGGRQIDR